MEDIIDLRASCKSYMWHLIEISFKVVKKMMHLSLAPFILGLKILVLSSTEG